LRRDKIENRQQTTDKRQEGRKKRKREKKKEYEKRRRSRAAAHDAFPESCASSGFVPFFHRRKPDQPEPWELISTG
jgi:hypothetical protein